MARLNQLRGSVAEQLTGTGRVARALFDGTLGRETYVDYLIRMSTTTRASARS